MSSITFYGASPKDEFAGLSLGLHTTTNPISNPNVLAWQFDR